MTTKKIHVDHSSSLASTSLPSTSFPSTSHASFSLQDLDDIFSYSDALFPNCDHLHFVSKISDAKHPVYQAYCSKTDRQYAVKTFYWQNNEPSECYTRELYFAKFTHPNIISIVGGEEEQTLLDEGEDSLKISYILMEYAQHGDFLDVLITRKISFDEVLIRTYFHQLIDAIEALHSHNVAHLDIKLENLLLADNYALKLVDFDLSYLPEDGKVTTRGTKNYRAPEIVRTACKDPYAADIYSAGIVLFLMKTRGKIAFKDGESIVDIKSGDSQLFWEERAKMLGESASFFGDEFKELFTWMTKPDPKDRATIAEVKKSRWYNMEVYTQQQVETFMRDKLCLSMPRT